MKNQIFKIDNSGKSKAFFLKKDNILKKKYISDLKKKLLRVKRTTEFVYTIIKNLRYR